MWISTIINNIIWNQIMFITMYSEIIIFRIDSN